MVTLETRLFVDGEIAPAGRIHRAEHPGRRLISIFARTVAQLTDLSRSRVLSEQTIRSYPSVIISFVRVIEYLINDERVTVSARYSAATVLPAGPGNIKYACRHVLASAFKLAGRTVPVSDDLIRDNYRIRSVE